MVGIQSLTVLMAATLVISTGVIIGSISITTSNDLLSSERNISDESVQNCLSSGSRDITSMTARFLHATVNGVGKSIDTHLDGPVNAMNSIAHFARSRHPNTTTDPHFIDTVMRGLLYSEYKTISKGRHNIMFGTLPWSPDHEELKIDEHAASFGWGGFVSFFARGAGTDDDVVAETRDPFSNDALLLTRYMYTGLADSQGNMIIPDNTTCDPTTPRFGVCISHRNLTETVGVSTARHQAVVNFKYDDDSIVDPVDVVTYHPMSEFHNGLWMMVTLPFSHPEMQNNYARQNNLVGFVSSIVDGQALINILKEQELPEDSVIYCVERHPRTQVVGSLLGYNRGRVWSTTKDGVKMLNITEHTEEGETEPSMIAQHGNYVFSSGGYHAARDRTSGDMEQWTAANGTQYWTVTTLLEKAQLGWFVCLLVPRSSVMESIDESFFQIREDKRIARESSDRKEEKSLIIMICVTAAVVTVLLFSAAVATRLIIAPLHHLAKDMANVAVMNLEAVHISTSVSRLSEVSAMQSSFQQMVANLLEYRNYIPQSVLLKTDEYDTEEGGGGAGGSAQLSHTRQHTSGTNSSPTGVSPCDAGGVLTLHQSHSITSSSLSGESGSLPTSGGRGSREQIKAVYAAPESMKRRSISVAYFNVRGWHRIIKEKLEPELLQLHSAYVAEVIDGVQGCRGVCDTFLGDRILATFNAYAVVNFHRLACLKSAVHVAKKLDETLGISVSYACASGDAMIGHMGCKGMKKVTINSTAVPWVVALERYNKKIGGRGLADCYINKDVTGHFVLKLCQACIFPKRSDQSIKVYEVKGTSKVEESEWMYQIQGANAHEHWNACFAAVIRGNFDEAESILDKVPTTDEKYNTLKEYIETKTYSPHAIEMH